MKRLPIHLFACLVLPVAGTLFAASCSKTDGGTPTAIDGYGAINLQASVNEAVATRAEIGLPSLGITPPAPSDFALRIHSDNPAVDSRWSSVDAFNAADTLFKAGTYTATLTYGDPEAEGEKRPYYSGTEQFALTAGTTANVAVTARIANSLAEVRTTEAFDRYFHDATFTLKTGSGNEFHFVPKAGVAATPVFVKAGTSLSISGTARRQSQTGTDNGPEIRLSAQPLSATVPRTRHIFTFDAADAGSATIHITLDENEEVKAAVDIELNDNAQ